jgi:hypothetical protein
MRPTARISAISSNRSDADIDAGLILVTEGPLFEFCEDDIGERENQTNSARQRKATQTKTSARRCSKPIITAGASGSQIPFDL